MHYNKFKQYIPHFVVFLFCLVTIFVWYSDGKLLYFADGTYPVGNPFDYLKEFAYGWKGSYSGGIVDTTGYAIVPLFVIIGCMHALGIGPVVSQAIFFFLVLFISGINCIALLRYFGKKYQIKENLFAIILPSLFYMCNLYIAINAWRMLIFLYLFYAMLPLLILLFLKYLETEKIKYVIWLSVVTSLFVSIALTNISFLLILFAIFLTIAFLFIGKKSPLRLAFLYCKGLLVWIPLNIWYLFPQFHNIAATASKATGGGDLGGSLSILNVISSHASFLHTLTLTGYYSLYDTTAGRWFYWADMYTTGPLMLFALIFPAILLFVIFNKNISRKIPRLYTLGVGLILIGSFIAKGSHSPGGEFFVYLFQKFPVPLLAFRAAYEKLGILIVIGYFIVIYLFYSFPIKNIKKYRHAVNWVVGAVILLLGFPMWTGAIFDSNNGIRPSARISIPADYLEVSAILKNDPLALTLSLPLQFNAWASSRWDGGEGGYLGNDAMRLLSQTPIISTDVGVTNIDDFNRIIESDFNKENFVLSNLVARHVKYVLVHKDINHEWALAYGKKMRSPEDFIATIEHSGYFVKKYESPNLALYELLSPSPEEYIYAAKDLFQFSDENSPAVIDLFIKDNMMSKYIFTHDENEKLSATRINSLFHTIDSHDIDSELHTVRTIVATTSPNATFFKTAGLPMVRILRTNNRIDISSGDSGSLYVNETRVLPEGWSSEIATINAVKENSYYVAIANVLYRVPEQGDLEIANRDAAGSLLLYTTKSMSGAIVENEWTKKVLDCSQSDELASLDMDFIHIASTRAIGLLAFNHIACTHKNIDLDGGAKYILSFDHMSSTTSKVGYALAGSGMSIGRSFTSHNSAWNEYKELITIPDGVSRGSLFIYAYPSDGKTANIVNYKNIKLEKVIAQKTLSTKLINYERARAMTGLDPNLEVEFRGGEKDFETQQIVDWEKTVHDCGISALDKHIALVFPDPQDTSIVELSSRGHIACTFGNVEIKPSFDYILDFAYRASSKNSAGYYIAFNDPKHTIISKRLNYQGKGELEDVSLKFTSPAGASSAVVYLYAFSPQKSSTQNISRYEHVKFTRLPAISSNFYLVDTKKEQFTLPRELEFSHINSSKNKVMISSATSSFYLVMNTTFNRGWKVSMDSAPIPHFEVNGFSNGWYIDPAALCTGERIDSPQEGCTQNIDGSYNIEFVIEYTPRRWFYFGLFVSGVAFILGAGYLIVGMLGGRQRRLLNNIIHNITKRRTTS